MTGELLAFLEKIPASFWGILFGSVLSLGGVFITNRANDQRLRAQLLHDREIRNRERELSFRKEIYLSAAEAISTGLIAIGRFGDLEVHHDQLTAAYIEKSPSIAKVHIIAKEETVRAVAALLSELNSVFLHLVGKRFPLMEQKNRVAILKGQIDAFGRERDRMLQLMKQFNLDGATDQRQWDVLQKNFNFEQQRVADTLNEHRELVVDLYSKQLEFMKECMEQTVKVSQLMVPVVVAVRKELEMPIDEAAYIQVIEESLRTQQARLNEFLKDSRQFIASESPPENIQAAGR